MILLFAPKMRKNVSPNSICDLIPPNHKIILEYFETPNRKMTAEGQQQLQLCEASWQHDQNPPAFFKDVGHNPSQKVYPKSIRAWKVTENQYCYSSSFLGFFQRIKYFLFYPNGIRRFHGDSHLSEEQRLPKSLSAAKWVFPCFRGFGSSGGVLFAFLWNPMGLNPVSGFRETDPSLVTWD